MTISAAQHEAQAALRGVPSLVWRAGQERRLHLIRQWAPLDGARALVDGCGVGMYVRGLQSQGARVWGLDVEHEHVAEAAANAPGAGLCQAAGEALPYPDGAFDLVLSHEVIEHVQDDRAYAAEMMRVLQPGGRAIVFCPNRLYPFETHGLYPGRPAQTVRRPAGATGASHSHLSRLRQRHLPPA
jgi:2-polyprenyl-3-methyl-5-hydroxy-6-metoxy-1,4-benzoquinol methylase